MPSSSSFEVWKNKILKKFSYKYGKPKFYATHARAMLSYEVHVAEHCNLNCRGCNHASPLATPAFIDFEEYQRDCARLGELFFHEAETISLLGGEPLLNPELTKLMIETRKNFSRGEIRIVTNGIILPQMDDRFWEICHEYDISIVPTRYPIKVDYAGLAKKAEKFGVKYEEFNKGQTIKTLGRFPLSPKGYGSPEKNFLHCNLANGCLTLSHGKMYTCSVAPHAHNIIDYYKLEDMYASPRDGIDIYAVKNAEELMDRLARPIPFCRYCKVNARVHGYPFGISQKKREEWLDE